MNPPVPNFYDPENARQLAEFAAESYSSFSSLPSHQIEDPATDTRVVLWQNTTDLVIAFRGTADLRNWLTDADCAFRQADGCKIHAGFWCALDSVWIKVRDAIDVARDDNKRVWLTGHSLGGALALLCAWRYMDWRRANPLQGLYTFGQPRVGDAAFAKSWRFQAGLNACAYRVINQDDIVPHSLDGTNWQTTGFLQNTNVANGTNLVTTVTNYAATLVNNMLYVTPYSIQNANASTNAIALGNLTVSFGNIVPGGYP